MPPNIWLSDLSYTQQGVSAEVMPAAIGGIATFCEARIVPRPGFHLFKYPETLIEAINHSVPDVIGFSNYCWNSSLSHEFAKVIKSQHPRVVVVMGGPDYPSEPAEQQRFMQQHPAVDFYVIGEAELAFAQLVAALIEHDFAIEDVKRRRLRSVHAMLDDGTFACGEALHRLTDLAAIPSPYLAGKMDDFFDGDLMPIIQTNRGCPFGCTYCVEGGDYYRKIFRNSQVKLADEIDYVGRKMAESRARGGRNDLFIADNNFGMFKEDLDTCELLARTRHTHGWPDYIVASTGKDRKERVLNAARILRGAIRLTGSVQSLDPEVLENIQRSNIDVRSLMEFADKANEVGANSCAEVILALPGDSAVKHAASIEALIEAGFTEIRMYQLMMLCGAEISSSESRQRHSIGTRFRAIPRSFGAYEFDEGTRIVAAEIEEIVTELETLTFEEYLECRKLNLIVAMFYNDGVFQGLLKLLQHLDISRFEWMRTIQNHPMDGELSRVIAEFLEDTRHELWDSREELEAFVQEPGNIEKFIEGKLGANVILKYKALTAINRLRELADVARTTVLEVIATRGKLDSEIEALVDDILTFEVISKEGVFEADRSVHHATLNYDVGRFLDSPVDTPVSEFSLEAPRTYEFKLGEEQAGVIERALNSYGRNDAGLARIFSRVQIKTLTRQVTPVVDGGAGFG